MFFCDVIGEILSGIFNPIFNLLTNIGLEGIAQAMADAVNGFYADVLNCET